MLYPLTLAEIQSISKALALSFPTLFKFTGGVLTCDKFQVIEKFKLKLLHTSPDIYLFGSTTLRFRKAYEGKDLVEFRFCKNCFATQLHKKFLKIAKAYNKNKEYEDTLRYLPRINSFGELQMFFDRTLPEDFDTIKAALKEFSPISHAHLSAVILDFGNGVQGKLTYAYGSNLILL